MLLWAISGSSSLPNVAVKLIRDPGNELIFSVASIWEIAIKHAKGLPCFNAPPGLVRMELLVNGYTELNVSGSHAAALENLPTIHKDPFDRLLIAQAMIEGITLLTADVTIARYPGPIRKV
jgi:PIN domain nuclease of toxin-antitoxin system